jgi:peptidyl-tRNA hydrolase
LGLLIVLYSVGQLVLDSLATRLGARFSPDKSISGYIADTKIDSNDKPFNVALYKTRTYSALSPGMLLTLQCMSQKRCAHELVRAPGAHGSPENRPRHALSDRFT